MLERWRREPFRLFFPLGVLLGWIGIGHWVAYATGLVAEYSCSAHGLTQTLGFLPAFAFGFLLTALPRRTAGPPPAPAIPVAAAAFVTLAAGGAITGRLPLAAAGSLGAWTTLVLFAAPRLAGRGAGRRPPAAFVLIPIAVLHGVTGALLLFADAPIARRAARLAIEQGVFCCLVLGAGALLYPLLAGVPPPADLDGSVRARRALGGYAALGVGVLATIALEAAGFVRTGPLLRGAVVAIGLVVGVGATTRPTPPGLARRVVHVALWLVPLGLVTSAALPDYRVPALHVTFIGGFALLALAVATHVTLGHLGLEPERDGRPAFLVVMLAGVALALLGRVTADWSDTYFEHLAAAAATWLAGTTVWLVAILRRQRRARP